MRKSQKLAALHTDRLLKIACERGEVDLMKNAIVNGSRLKLPPTASNATSEPWPLKWKARPLTPRVYVTPLRS
jgi:hypothetical protein